MNTIMLPIKVDFFSFFFYMRKRKKKGKKEKKTKPLKRTRLKHRLVKHKHERGSSNIIRWSELLTPNLARISTQKFPSQRIC